jgi:hypothetical protein
MSLNLKCVSYEKLTVWYLLFMHAGDRIQGLCILGKHSTAELNLQHKFFSPHLFSQHPPMINRFNLFTLTIINHQGECAPAILLFAFSMPYHFCSSILPFLPFLLSKYFLVSYFNSHDFSYTIF